MEKITTHVLDTASGQPAAGVRVRLFRGGELLADTLTNADGRCDAPLLTSPPPATYEIRFSIGDYYGSRGSGSAFLDEIPVRFTTEPGQSYHVPLICTPWSYSTYRGS